MDEKISLSMRLSLNLPDARRDLNELIIQRLVEEPLEEPADLLRFPVGFFFIRGDRQGVGKQLLDQMAASFEYWHHDANKYFDMIFPGWYKEGNNIRFDIFSFLLYRQEFEAISKWEYSGETDILLLNFDYQVAKNSGDFSFAETIYLPVEAMMRDNRISSLDSLMHDLIKAGKATWPRTDKGGIWDISDRIGFYKGRRALWDYLKKLLLRDFSKVVDELRPYAICDLRRQKKSIRTSIQARDSGRQKLITVKSIETVCSQCENIYSVTLIRPECETICPECHHLQAVNTDWE